MDTHDETYAVIESVDTRYVRLCPHAGGLLAGGVDFVHTLTDFRSIIGHVHLNDYNGGDHNDGRDYYDD